VIKPITDQEVAGLGFNEWLSEQEAGTEAAALRDEESGFQLRGNDVEAC
jgi:hypothetical protein